MRSVLVATFIFSAWMSMAQNLESIGKEKPLTVSGGLSLNQIVYGVTGIESRRDPYSYFASGNLNFALYGWSVPVSFSLSNQDISYQQPFNQYGIHPTYKWITAHLGYASMTFSPYTLNGHIFKGAGVDVTPTEKLKLSAMYGRLLRAVEPDSLTPGAVTPAFRRIGYGFKAHYGDAQHFGEFTMFRAADDSTSISYVPENENILPQQNLVFSVAGGVTLLQKIQIKAELATSGITRDLRTDQSDGPGIFNKTGSLFTPTISSAYYNAMKGNITYMGNGYNLGVGYERIDPGYKTLGAYFFNNDLENITVNGATAIAKGKVNIAVNAGTQRDNLDGSKVSTLRRWVSSVNLGFTPNERLNLSGSYSNFQTFTNIRSQFVDINQLTPYDNLDTLNFTQITQNLNVVANYTLGTSDKKRQNVSANASVMKAADNQVGVSAGNTFYNLNTAYSLNVVPRNITFSASLNYSQNKALSFTSSTVGPTLSVSKSLFDKKLRLTGSCSLNNTYTAGKLANRVTSVRVNSGYSIRKKHNFNLSLVTLNRTTVAQETGTTDFTEFTGTLGYSFSF